MNVDSRWKRIMLTLVAVGTSMVGCQRGGSDPRDALHSTARVVGGTIAEVAQMAFTRLSWAQILVDMGADL